MLRPLALLSAAILCAACSAPPQKEIDRAQGAIDAARAAGAERYATTEFTAATTALDQAHEAVEERDYRLALSKAVDAGERAQEAARMAADGKARARSEAEAAVTATDAAVQQFRKALKSADEARLPAPHLAKFRTTAEHFEQVLQEARTLLSSEQYTDVPPLLRGVPQKIHEQIVELNEVPPARPPRRRR